MDVPERDTQAHDIVCYCCGHHFHRYQTNFTVTNSPMYRGRGYLPYCNNCIDNMYVAYLDKYLDGKKAMWRMCMRLNIYWSPTIYAMVEKSVAKKSSFRLYVGKANIARYIDKTYDDSIEEGIELIAHKSKETAPDETVIEKDDETSIDLELFWGKGYERDFYLDLDRRYKFWTKDLGDLAPNEVSLYKNVCLLEAIISRDAAEGKPVDKNISTLNATLGSLKLKPVQQKDDSGALLDKTAFGVGISWCEQYKPISEPKPEFKDVDGIARYISIWLYGHLSKMLGKKNLYSKLYEDEIARLRVERPGHDDEDDEDFVYDILSREDGDSG